MASAPCIGSVFAAVIAAFADSKRLTPPTMAGASTAGVMIRNCGGIACMKGSPMVVIFQTPLIIPPPGQYRPANRKGTPAASRSTASPGGMKALR